MNRAAKGATLERKTMAVLRGQGWHCIRGAGSKGDGGVDVVAWKGPVPHHQVEPAPHTMKLIQVKANRFRPESLGSLKEVPVPHNARKEVWVWKDRQKDPTIITL